MQRTLTPASALWVVMILGVLSTSALAQSAPRLPLDSRRAPEPAAPATLSIDRDRFAEQAPPGAATIWFRLTSVDLVGNTALPTSLFAPMWAPALGREVSLASVFDIAARITATYRNAGYVLSHAFVPQQEIDPSNGRVRIRVAEGFVSSVQIAKEGPGKAYLLAMLAPIQAERPLTLATLERQLLLINDLPGLSSSASLKAGLEPNSSHLELAVQHDANAFSVGAHNRTSAAVGPMRYEVSAERRGLFGGFNRHVLRWVGSGDERLNLIAYSGDRPIGENGTSASWSASTSRAKPKSGELFQLDTDSSNGSLGLSHAVLRSRSLNVTARAALTAYNGSSDIAGGLRLSEEKLRAVRIGLAVDGADRLSGVNLLDLEFARGLSGLGASQRGDPTLARADSNPQFSKTTLYAARLQSLGGEWSLLFAASGQASNDLLGSAEQFSLGGDTFLRAYDPSELLGDSGAAGKIELRFNFQAGERLTNTVYAYLEGGRVWLRDASGGSTRQSAASSGLGLRFTWAGGPRGYLEVAKPSRRPTAKNGNEDARFFAGIGMDF